MFLALTALVLHVSATAQAFAPSIATTVSAAAAVAATAPSETARDAKVQLNLDLGSNNAPALIVAASVASATATPDPGAAPEVEPQPALPVAYMPGRLTPEPVVAGAPAAATAAFQPIAQQTAHAGEERTRRLWLGLSLAQHSAAAFDAWSTRQVISSGAGRELNPMLRPFASNASLYAAIQVGPAILDYVSYRMMHSEHGWARRTWWVPQAVGTVVSIASGVHNLGVYSAR